MCILFRLRQADLQWQEIDAGMMVKDFKRREYIALNRSAAVIWRVLESRATQAEVVDAVVEVFGIPRAVATQDVERFVTVLREADLIEEFTS